MHPEPKTIKRLSIAVDYNGWPRWTRITNVETTQTIEILDEEQVRDLHYVLERIIAFLDDQRMIDRKQGIIA